MAAGLPIGTRIKRARERKRWTQKELADALGVNIKSVDNWENGRTAPRNRLGALEEVLGISFDEDEPQPVISDRLLSDMRRELGDERAARMVAALEEASVARPGLDDGPAAGRRVDQRGERPVERPDKQGDVFLPGGHPGAEGRPGDADSGDNDQVPHAGARQ